MIHWSRLIRLVAVILGMVGALHAGDEGSRPPTKDRGLYALWYNKQNRHAVFSLPFITGGQIVCQWHELEPQPGKYNFDPIDRELRLNTRTRTRATIQLNGNRKPDWLFDVVPYHPGKLSHQVRDPKGSLMYWHPTYRDAYVNLLKAFSNWLRKHPNKNLVLGIRLNPNGFGTEHTHVDKKYIPLSQWIVPKGVDRTRPITPWSSQTTDAYIGAVVDAYVEHLSPFIRVFVRNGFDEKYETRYKRLFETGKLAWFHTSSEVEPRGAFAEKKYGRFYDYARSGKTVAFAEPWASAWGDHGQQRDDRWCSPPQWLYWTQLFNLHCGVSFIGEYTSDLRVAIDGTYTYGKRKPSGPDARYQREFTAALEFAAKYAGYHASPATSPGAWIAFRENHVTLAENGMPEARRKLKRFTGDYTFLMTRLPGDKSTGVTTIGPGWQRYGAWARKVPPNSTMRLKLDPAFAHSQKGKAHKIRIVYLGNGAAFTVRYQDATYTIAANANKLWNEAVLTIPAGASLGDTAVAITAADTTVILHMLEVQR